MNPNMMMNSMSQPQAMMGMNMQNPMYPAPQAMSDQNPNMMMGNNITYAPNDIDNKLAKLERQIKRLDARVSRLESISPANSYNTMTSYEQMSSGFNSNML